MRQSLWQKPQMRLSGSAPHPFDGANVHRTFA